MNSTPDNHEQGLDEPDREFSSKQEQAIIALLNEPTVVKAAERVGVTERTLHRWLEEERFLRAFRCARRQAFAHSISLMQHYAPHAVNMLAKVMSDPAAAHSARVSAAVAMLRFGREGIELDDLAGRVETLENATKQSGKRSRLN